ncbi:multidrug effflux MFS transporter [Acetobacterium carbinolicum]|jgi:DHA1 family bicyclomycin/chloramphenicol resistance-like MFS transporter|uniref:multidrug effflux MFS transporter n=1 Tax=Acetobacterium TaxID=33951 RepID=UPI000DBEC8CB|nr:MULTISPECIES: multidrug effflux MFS transporter [unclassified Acetobacterium]AWW27459.1 MFS transporter [Acetobacterium sp. KB-1]MDK2942089.1 transporter, family, multidrug resistance protein [Acetobacterium sp.]MDZ5726101.1 multidrug effflux MFS transporter [Acetobacterium sp. K1/6]
MNNPKNASNDSTSKQKYLGDRGLLVFLVFLSAFAPLSTDLYLPALPTMTTYFNVPGYLTNLTLILFFIFFSVGMLIWGPLSDKFGRRPVLLVGVTGYAIAGLLCAVSGNIYQLIFFRVLQAIGGSSASAVATAIVKDVYLERKREKTLAIVQSMVIIVPAVAPVIGALLLTLTSWRGIFIIQGLLGIIILLGSIAFQETIEKRGSGSILRTLGRLGVVLKNPAFTSLLFIFSLSSISGLAFISSSSYIYQNDFGVSSQIYSYFFAFNALAMMLGPLIYIKLSNHFKRFSIINLCFGITILSGLAILLFGQSNPFIFALALFPATLASSCARPPSAYLMLDQQTEDAGSASSLMGSFATIMGSLGMIIISFNMDNLILIIGSLNIILGLLSGGLWLVVTKTPLLSKIREA